MPRKARPSPREPGTSDGADGYRFPYLGDGGWLPVKDAFSAWVVFDDAPNEAKQKKLLTGIPAMLRPAIVWDGPVVRIGTPRERSWDDANRVGSLVRKHFGKGKAAPRLSKRQAKELSGPDFDPKALGIAAQAMADFGARGPWVAFYAALDEWLLSAHAKLPILLFLRPVSRAERQAGLSTVHEASLDGVFAGSLLSRLAARAGAASASLVELARELVLYLETRAMSAAELEALAPLLVHAFGIDDHAAAALAVVKQMPPASFADFLQGMPALAALELLLRHDYVESFAARKGFEDLLDAALARFWKADPSAADADRLALRIRYVLRPLRMKDALLPVYRMVVAQLDAHAASFTRVRFASIAESLTKGGFDVADLEAAIAKMP